ncbi:MAG: tail fiber domain-containing protein [Deltaproteobacteria bacterium]
MKRIIALLVLSFWITALSAQVGINETNSSPDASAMLDVSSTNKGLLIPRMTGAEMNAIVTPADGLMIFNTTDNCFYFRITSGWKKLISETNNHGVSDSDGDSYLSFRQPTTDDDTLRIFFNGIEKYKISASTIEPVNNGSSVYIGKYTGKKDNGSENANTAIGSNSMANIKSGNQNTALGYSSLEDLKTGLLNTGIGGIAMKSNRAKNRNTAIGYGAMMFADSNSVAFDAYNTAIGTHALRGSFNPANNTGIYNTAAGGRAMNENTSGSRNSALGYHALYSNTTGNSNIAVGIMALYSNTERSNLVAIGDSALYNNGIGATLSGHSSGNTAIGSKSLYANTTGSYNCAVGLKSLNSNTTGYENTASGWNSLNNNTEGKFNTAYGSRTLFNNTTGNYNVAIGTVTMYANISGSGNSALGHSALNSNEIGFNNTAIGSEALYKNSSGNLNTALGNRAGFEITTGTHNIVLGHHAGKNITSGNYNILVGDNVETPSATGSYQMVIGDSLLLYGDISNKRIGIGTSNPKAILHTHGTGTGGGNVLFTGQRKISGAGDPPATGAGTRMMWYPDYAAFRVGQVEGNQWDKTNIGTHSLAVGLNTKASATSCIALGYGTTASNDFATALGVNTNATGNSSTAFGSYTTAPSYAETVLGQYNTIYTPVGTNVWNAGDRLFVVGNGTENSARNNAFTILKNGNSGIGTEIPNEKLEVAGNIHVSGADRTIFNRSNNYLAFGTNNTERARITNVGNVGIGLTVPNEKLEVAGNIHVSGADRTIYNRSNNYLAFGTNNTERIRITNTGNVGIGTTPNANALLHINGIGTSEGNVLFAGSYKTTPGEPATTGAGTRLMWYPDKAAFRAGNVSGTQWNKANIGIYSVALGQDPTAKGANSIALGQGMFAEGANSVAIGQNSSAYAANSIAIGELITANGINSVGLGRDNWLNGLNATALGASNSANGDYSTVMGNLNGASGKNSLATGLSNDAPSFVESVFGAYATSYTPTSSIAWDTDDRLFVIGNGTSTTNRKNAMTVLKNGNIGIGTDSPAELVHLRNNSGDAGIRIQSTNVSDIGFYSSSGYVAAVGINVSQGHLYLYNGGNVSVKNGRLGIGNIDPGQKLDITAGNGRVESGYSWLTNSDIRYKKNITTLENSLEKISKIRGVRYDLKKDEQIIEGKGKHIGFIAQELENEFPEFVVTEDNGYKSVSYDKMTAVLVEAVKEQQSQIDELKKIVQQQQAQISELLKSERNNVLSMEEN